MKKFLTIFAVAALALLTVASCKKDKEDESEIALQGISLNATTLDLFVGDTQTLTVTYKPTNATSKPKATWSSSAESVATVSSDGVVTAVAAGEATITATVEKFTATCTVTVTNKDDYKGPVQGTSAWSVVGTLLDSNWGDVDYVCAEEDGIFVLKNVRLAETDQFKFRKDKDWAVNRGGAFGTLGEGFDVVHDGANIVVGAAGIYDLYYNSNVEQAAVVTKDGTPSWKELPPAPEGKIKIDGDFSDWADVEGVSNGSYGMFKFTVDDNYVYFYSHRTTEGRFADIWGGSGYVYVAFDLDNDMTTGETLWGNGPYEFVGVLYPYGGTAEAPAINETPGDASLPESSTLANAVCQGVIDAEGAKVEIRVPRADLPTLTDKFMVYSWGNKDLAKVEYPYPYETSGPEEPKEMVPFDPENFAAIDWSNKDAATWYYFAENYDLPNGFTFILHIYPNSLNTAGMRVGNFGSNDADPSPCNMLRFGQNGNNAELEWMVDTGAGRSQKELLAPGFVTEKWQAIVLTADKATGSYKIYRNAELGAERTYTYNENMKFGAIEFANSWGASWRSAFDGRMALLSVYNKALTADEIAQNIFTTPVSDACVGFWPMNDGEGGILAADQSRAIKEQIDLTKAVRNDNDNTTQNYEFDATPYITWTTGNKIEKEEPAPEVLSVSEFIALEDNTEATFSGIVAAVATNGPVITDGEKNIYVFKPTTTPAIGDKVTVKATKTTYYGLIETKQGGELTVESSGNEVPRTEMVDITASFDAYPNDAPTSDYVSVKGTIAVSGNYVNFTVAGAESRQGSVQGMDLKAYDGKLLVLKGYYIGTSGSGGKYVNIAVTDATVVPTDGNSGEDLGDPIDANPWE